MATYLPIPIAPRTGRDEPLPIRRLGRALALGLRGVTVQTLLSVFGSNQTGKCTPVTKGLSHPQNDSPSEASSHFFRGRHAYNTPFGVEGPGSATRLTLGPAAASAERRRSSGDAPPPGVEPAGAFFWLQRAIASHHRKGERYYGRGRTITVRR